MKIICYCSILRSLSSIEVNKTAAYDISATSSLGYEDREEREKGEEEVSKGANSSWNGESGCEIKCGVQNHFW